MPVIEISQDSPSAHLDWLKGRLAEYESKLARAEQVVAKLKPLVTHLSATIEGIESESDLTKPSQSLWKTEELPPERTTPNMARMNAHVRPFTPGNHSSNAPPRKSQFQNVSIPEAAQVILGAVNLPMHVDDIVRAIYVVNAADDIAAVKQSVVSSLLRAAKKGRLQAVGGNRFMSTAAQTKSAEA